MSKILAGGMDVLLATDHTADLTTLWEHAHKDVLAKRGGAALLTTLCDGAPFEELLPSIITSGSLWLLIDGGVVKGLCLCRRDVIEAVYVGHPYRRHKVATTLVRSLLAGTTPPVDAYALPGDRAMKSLYESLGWKARLLTMRDA